LVKIIKMPNKSYRKGYNFERRVKQYLEDKGYFVMRNPKSRFPDGLAVNKEDIFLYECKVNKYLSKEEKKKVKELKKITGLKFVVFYREGNKLKKYFI